MSSSSSLAVPVPNIITEVIFTALLKLFMFLVKSFVYVIIANYKYFVFCYHFRQNDNSGSSGNFY